MEDLLNFARNGESEFVEFKKSTASLREGVETICAFANHRGGHLFFGINDDGTVVGQQVTDDTIKNIANTIKLNTDPKLYPSIEKVEIEAKECVLVTIEESPLRPHLAYGRAFLRVGTTNQRLDQNRYEYLLQQRFNGYAFDYQILPEAVIEDIDNDLLYEFLEIANSVRNLNENLLLPPDIILKKLDLMKDSGITKGALLLFGKDPGRFFSGHFEIKCGNFQNDSDYDDILNEKEFHQNLIDQFRATLNFIQESIKTCSIKNGIHQVETLEFPVGVIREALVNMIVHRDYRQDIKSSIEIRPSTISLNNPALLFGPTITIETLKKYHPSRPGNKLIAKIFYLMGLFENWGSGTLKIIEETVKYGKSAPQLLFENGMFRVILLR